MNFSSMSDSDVIDYLTHIVVARDWFRMNGDRASAQFDALNAMASDAFSEVTSRRIEDMAIAVGIDI
jgi:hypothetical protein